jgi:hypothetical protein
MVDVTAMPWHSSAPTGTSGGTRSDPLLVAGISLGITCGIVVLIVSTLAVYCVVKVVKEERAERRWGPPADGSHHRHGRWVQAYRGVPIYLTTQLEEGRAEAAAGGEEAVVVPPLSDIPEAAESPVLSLNRRVRLFRGHRRSETNRSASVAAPSEDTANPLSPQSADAAEEEVCVGVVVSAASEEERHRAVQQYFAERDYGTALYFSRPPVAEEDDGEGSNPSFTMVVWSETDSCFVVV